MARPKLSHPNFRLVPDAKSDIWQISYTCPVDGYTKKRSTGARDKAEAKRAMPGIIAEMLGNRQTAPSYTIGKLLDEYERATCKGKTSTFYSVQSLKSYFADFTPDQLNDAAWKNYRTHRTSQHNRSAAFAGKAKPVKDSTATKDLNIMRGAISWARRNGWQGLAHVVVHVPDVSNYAVQEYLGRDEVHALLSACQEPHTELFVLIALATGARMSAVLELTWDKVHWPARAPLEHTKALWAVNVRPHPFHDVDFDLALRDDLEPLRLDLGRGRGNKRRGTGVIARQNSRLYIALVDAWERRNPACPYVVSFRGKGLKTINLEPAYERAGLIKYARRVHLLKHTCCSLLVQSGVSYEQVAELVGTRADMIRKHYGHLSPAQIETAGVALAF